MKFNDIFSLGCLRCHATALQVEVWDLVFPGTGDEYGLCYRHI